MVLVLAVTTKESLRKTAHPLFESQLSVRTFWRGPFPCQGNPHSTNKTTEALLSALQELYPNL